MRFTIKSKLALAFGLIIVLLAGLAVYSITSLGTLNSAITRLIDGPAKRLEYAYQAEVFAIDAIRSQNSALLTDDAKAAGKHAKAQLPVLRA